MKRKILIEFALYWNKSNKDFGCTKIVNNDIARFLSKIARTKR